MTKRPDEAFTSRDARTMTESEITEYWIARQRYLRDKGEPHYDALRVPETDEIIARI
jgi:hypothetical protein